MELRHQLSAEQRLTAEELSGSYDGASAIGQYIPSEGAWGDLAGWDNSTGDPEDVIYPEILPPEDPYAGGLPNTPYQAGAYSDPAIQQFFALADQIKSYCQNIIGLFQYAGEALNNPNAGLPPQHQPVPGQPNIPSSGSPVPGNDEPATNPDEPKPDATGDDNQTVTGDISTEITEDTRVVVLDKFNEDDLHGEMVNDIISQDVNQEEIALVSITSDRKDESGDESDNELDISSLNKLIDNSLTHDLRSDTDKLRQILDDPDGENLTTINMSFGLNDIIMADQILAAADEDENLETQLRSELGVGEDDNLAEALLNRIHERRTNSRDFQDALSDYQDITQDAADRGIALVVAASNSQESIDQLSEAGVDVPQDAGVNYYAMSNDIIVAGAIDDRGTASMSDDVVAPFSSAYTGEYQVTVAADGVDVNGQDDLDGTSFAAPLVTGLIAEMKAANPDLSFDDIVQILQDTAYDNPNIDNAVEGAGSINPEAALDAAKAA